MDGKKTIVHRACRQMLRPIASMLLRCGMTWKEFSDLSKSVFVEAATAEFGIRGRPTNVSRVSILTGISRKEVKRQRDLLESDQPLVERKTTGATNVLSAWFQDSAFRDANSVPMLLEEHGAGTTFETLCGRYGGGIAPTTMLKELLNTGAVARQQDGRLKVLSRYYQPAMHDDENLLFAVDRIYDVVETMNNNVFPGDKRQPRFGGYADHVEFPVSAIPRFQKFLDERGQTFLEEIDDWLAQHAGGNNQQTNDVARVGVALFATERPINQE